jgi:hypothetical protein
VLLHLIETQANRAATTFLAAAIARELDEDPSHHLRCQRQEVCAIPELHVIDVDEPQVRSSPVTSLAAYDPAAPGACSAARACGAPRRRGVSDWLTAERCFQRALALNPNHPEAYLHYGELMEAFGELDRGLQLKLRGLECDQTSALAHVRIALSFFEQRRYDDVIVWTNKTLDRDPEHLFARELLAGAYWKKGDWERLLTEDLRRAEAARTERGRAHRSQRNVQRNRGRLPSIRLRRGTALHPHASGACGRVAVWGPGTQTRRF